MDLRQEQHSDYDSNELCNEDKLSEAKCHTRKYILGFNSGNNGDHDDMEKLPSRIPFCLILSFLFLEHRD